MTMQESLNGQPIDQRTLELAMGFGRIASVKYQESLTLLTLIGSKMPDVGSAQLPDLQPVLSARVIETTVKEGQS